MTDERAYRIHLRFAQDEQKFVALAPELGVQAAGPTRAEAITAIEEAIEIRLQDAASGAQLPQPIDVKEVDGKLSLALSQGLVRELLFQAQQNGLSAEALATELLARGLGHLEARSPRRGPRPATSPEATGGEAGDQRDPQPPQRDDRRGEDRRDDRGPRRRRQGEGYRPELEDKANFLEYLRGLEKGPGGGGGRGRGR